jgi:WhiB family redox-sensing transcriptional regulator
MTIQGFNMRLADDRRWTEVAECAKPGSTYMYPSKTDSIGIQRAKSLCAACPVRGECLTEAMRINEQHGIWGGLTADERNKLRSNRARAARARAALANESAK